MVQVVSDLEEPFLPLPDDMMVNLADSRTVVEALLDAIPTTFANNTTVCALNRWMHSDVVPLLCLGPYLCSANMPSQWLAISSSHSCPWPRTSLLRMLALLHSMPAPQAATGQDTCTCLILFGGRDAIMHMSIWHVEASDPQQVKKNLSLGRCYCLYDIPIVG